jgi:adenylate kinase family enzyme
LKNIILISGKKQSGKNTVADYISNKYEYTQMSFAEELKEYVAKLLKSMGVHNNGFDIRSSDFEKDEFKKQVIPYRFNKKKRTYRELLQYFGTEMMRNFFNDELWVEIVCDQISMFHKSKSIVISDWRFTNEYNSINEAFKNTHNIITIRVERESCNFNDSHISENALRDFKYDCVIDNNGTKDELYDKIDKLFEEKLI